MVVFLIAAVAVILALMVFFGWYVYFGPLRNLSITRIRLAYRKRPKGGIVFYGASNFTYWFDMQSDLAPHVVQNHGFGGSTDNDLMACADRLLYPYEPGIVVFQSGSNDFMLGMTVDQVNANKDRMYSMFRERLPDAQFVVLSMLPLPGRTEPWPSSRQVNDYLAHYCSTHDRMVFVDATERMLTPEGDFCPQYYRRDGIHLNREGQQRWAVLIRAALDELSATKDNSRRKE